MPQFRQDESVMSYIIAGILTPYGVNIMRKLKYNVYVIEYSKIAPMSHSVEEMVQHFVEVSLAVMINFCYMRIEFISALFKTNFNFFIGLE